MRSVEDMLLQLILQGNFFTYHCAASRHHVAPHRATPCCTHHHHAGPHDHAVHIILLHLMLHCCPMCHCFTMMPQLSHVPLLFHATTVVSCAIAASCCHNVVPCGMLNHVDIQHVSCACSTMLSCCPCLLLSHVCLSIPLLSHLLCGCSCCP